MFARTILDLHGDLERITKNGKKMEQRDKRDHVLSLDRLNRFVSTGKSEPAITRACAHGIRKQKRPLTTTFPSEGKEGKGTEINL